MERRNLLWAGCIAGVLALYCWTFSLSPKPFDSVGAYNRLADAFVHGHLHLRNEPPPGLLALPDPWEPTENYQYSGAPGVFDMALHNRHLYPYWGPVPTLLIFTPVHILGLGNVSERWVTLLLCFVLIALLALFVREAAGRFAPRAPPWTQPLALLVLATASGILPLVEKPSTYTLAIAAGDSLMVGGALMLLRGVREGGELDFRALALGSLFFGLAFGSRWSLGPALLAPLGLFVWLWRRTDAAQRRPLALALLGPMTACVVLLMIYNSARFGSPVETGERLVLAGYGNPHKTGLLTAPSLRAVMFYVLKPFTLAAYFPYLWLNVKPVGGGYRYQEPMVGLIWTLPVALCIPFALRLVRRAAPALTAVIAGLAVIGLAIFLPHLVYNFAAQRYAADFEPLVALAAVLAGIALIVYRFPAESARRVRGVAIAVVAVVVLFDVTLSENVALLTHPGAVAKLDRDFAGVPAAAAFVLNKPLLSSINGQPALPGRNDPNQPLIPGRLAPPLTVTPGGAIGLVVIAPHAGTLVVKARFSPTASVVPGADLRPFVLRAGVTTNGQPIDGSDQALEVRGRRGRNRITLGLVAGSGAATGANTVQVDNLRVSER